MAEIKRLDLGNLNPIYERKLNKTDVHQVKGRWNVCRDGKGGKGEETPKWGILRNEGANYRASWV